MTPTGQGDVWVNSPSDGRDAKIEMAGSVEVTPNVSYHVGFGDFLWEVAFP